MTSQRDRSLGWLIVGCLIGALQISTSLALLSASAAPAAASTPAATF